MESVVLDSSALLAIFQNEVGKDLVLAVLPTACMSTVNAAEVQAKLIRNGDSPEAAWFSITSGVARLVSFDPEQARRCGDLAVATRHAGLSAGDRACLALALILELPVYTADKAWNRFEISVDVHLIR